MAQPYVGEIKFFSFPFAPRYYALCNGQLLGISQNQALFSLLGTMYGGNGSTNFGLPNLQSRTPIHFGNTLTQGGIAGAETVQLTIATMPAHTHSMIGTTATADRKSPKLDMFANDTSPAAQFYGPATNLIPIASETISAVGGGQPHSNMQPYLVANYCIALSGAFPSRS